MDKSHKKAKTAHGNGAQKAKQVASKGQLDSPFMLVDANLRLSIPPVFAGDLGKGAQEMLDSLVMRYNPALDAVLLSYSDLAFEDSTADIQNDCPFAVVNVGFKAVVWSPKVGQSLAGTHSISSDTHISLILYKTFNVSIPIDRIPHDKYRFDKSIRSSSDSDEESSDSEDEDDEESVHEHSSGRWVEISSGKVLGDGEDVVFTVTGKQISHQMLSLTGSLMGMNKSTAHMIAPAPNNYDDLEDAFDSDSDIEEQIASTSKSHTATNVSTAAHQAQPAGQISDPFDEIARNMGTPPPTTVLTTEDEKRLRKENRKAEKEAEKAAKKAAKEAAAVQESEVQEGNPKEEGYYPGMAEETETASQRKKEKKSKRKADDADLSTADANKKRKKDRS